METKDLISYSALETDALRDKLFLNATPTVVCYMEMVLHARKLEKERDEARECLDSKMNKNL